MAWRPPKTLFVLGKVVEVRQVTAAELHDLLSDHDDERQWGGWDGDSTIYLLKTASPTRKNSTFWHEVAHMLVDLFDKD